MSSSDSSEDNNKTDDPYDRMLVFVTGKRSEDRKSKEKAIRFPVKLMYVIQCGDYNHLIDWFEEENPSEDNDNSGESHEKRENESNRRTVSIIEKNSGFCGDDEVKNDNSGDSKKDNKGNDLHSYNLPPPQSTAFIIYDKAAFETHVLPAIFKEGKFDSFERKLYRWGFAKQKTRRRSTPDSSSLKTCYGHGTSSSIYEHPYFCRGDYATASTIACSGSEVKRYKQIQKDKKKQIPKRRRDSKVSSAGSTILRNNMETSPAAAPTDRKMAAAPANIDNASSNTRTRPPPKDNQLHLDQEDRWDQLYSSALHSSNEEEEKNKKNLTSLDHCKSGHEKEEHGEGSDAFIGSSRFREDFLSTTSVMASCVDDEKQRTKERAQNFGLNVTTFQHKQDQVRILGETNSSTMTNMLLLEQGQDTILMQHLRRRRNSRQIILEMIQRSYQN